MDIAAYTVDKALYYRTDHRAYLVTTEYTCKTDILAHLLIGNRLCISLNERMQAESFIQALK